VAEGLTDGKLVDISAGKTVDSFDFCRGSRGMKAGCGGVIRKAGEWKAVLFESSCGD